MQTLSQYLGKAAPPPAPTVDFVKPLSPEEERTSPEFFKILNFILQFCPTNPSESARMARFATINVGSGKTFAPKTLSPEMQKAVQDGMADAWQAFDEFKKTEIDTGKIYKRRWFWHTRIPEQGRRREHLSVPLGGSGARDIRKLEIGGALSGLFRRFRRAEAISF